jgi:hypothetical protein
VCRRRHNMADIETYASVSMEDKAAAVKRYVNDQTEFARMRVCACCGLRDPIGLLLQTGDYREVKYSAVDSNGALACKIFTKSLGQDVKQYIVAGLRACVESAGRCHSVAGLARSIDAAAHELCFATDERASANVRSASCLSGCGVSTDASSASRAPNLRRRSKRGRSIRTAICASVTRIMSSDWSRGRHWRTLCA